MMRYVFIAVSGAIAALMTNRGVAVFNDGFRPILPQYFSKSINRKTLAGISFAMSFGLIIGFGIPTSLASTIIIAHALWLSTDIIGTMCPDTKLGAIISLFLGATWGVLLLGGLDWFAQIVNYLPFNFVNTPDGGQILGLIASPVIVAFAAFPTIAVAKQFGTKKGLISAVVSLSAYILTNKFNSLGLLVNDVKFSLNVNGMAMLGGMIMLIIYASRVKNNSDENNGGNVELSKIFSTNVDRLRKNWLLLGLGAAAAGALYSTFIIAADPISQNLAANGDYVNAAMVVFIRSIGFLPLIFTTAITTGVYTVKGATFQAAISILVAILLPPVIVPYVAAAACFALTIVELLFFGKVAALMDRFSAMREMGDFIRDAMSQTLELALLIGGVLAVNAMMSNMGYFVVLGAYFINKAAAKPIVPLAIGPIVAIIFGLLMNILKLITLV